MTRWLLPLLLTACAQHAVWTQAELERGALRVTGEWYGEPAAIVLVVDATTVLVCTYVQAIESESHCQLVELDADTLTARTP